MWIPTLPKAQAPNTPIDEVRWIVLDTEFTKAYECLEISLRVVGDPDGGFSRLIRLPGNNLATDKAIRAYRRHVRLSDSTNAPQESTGHFSKENDDAAVSHHLESSCLFVEVVNELLWKALPGVVIAHNYDGAEARVLSHEFDCLGLAEPEILHLCTLKLARRLLPQSPAGNVGYTQDALGFLLGVPFDAANYVRHTADGDTEHLARIWPVMLERIRQSPLGLKTLADLLWLQNVSVNSVLPMHTPRDLYVQNKRTTA